MHGKIHWSDNAGGLLLAIGCVSVVLLAWAVPADSLFFAQFQQVSSALCLIVFALLVWVMPQYYSTRKLGIAELVLCLFIIEGVLAGVFSLNPLSRWQVIGWWLQAFLFLFLVARIANRVILTKVMELYCGFSALGATLYLLNHWLDLPKMPFDILQNHLAMLLILPFFFFLSRALNSPIAALRIQNTLVFLLVLAAILLTQSRAVWIGVLISLLLFVVNREKRISNYALGVRISLMLVSGLVVFWLVGFLFVWFGNDSLFSVLETFNYMDEGSIGGRMRRWANALPLIRDNWFMGIGTGNWSAVFENYRHSVLPDSSGALTVVNSYIHILAETGLIGFLLCSVFVWLLLRSNKGDTAVASFRSIAHYSLIAWLITLCFHSVYDFKIVLLGFVFTCSFLLWRDSNSKSEENIFLSIDLKLPVVILLISLLLIVEFRFSLAQLEQRALTGALQKSEEGTRRFWSIVDPFSELISAPIDLEYMIRQSENLEGVSKYLPPDSEDLNLQVGRYEEKMGNLDVAINWYQKAIDRNPSNIFALTSLCSANISSGEYELARVYCGRAAMISSHSPAIYGLNAVLSSKSNESVKALEQLKIGRNLLWNRMDLNDFGIQSRGSVTNYYRNYREFSGSIMLQETAQEEAIEDTLREVIRTPKLHKSLAVSGCDIYFSANINARYNLWKINYCTRNSGVLLQTNDSHSPFRLSVSKDYLYFISDKRGDGNYQLYRVDLASNVTSNMDTPKGKMVSYSLSSSGNYISIIKYSGKFYRLFIGGSKGEKFDEMYKSRSRISDVAWHENKEELMFVVGKKTIVFMNAQRESRRLVTLVNGEISDPVFSPDENRYAYTLRTGRHNSSLVTGSFDNTKQDVVYSVDDSLLANPVWLGDENVIVHQVKDNQVLLLKIPVESGVAVTVGPVQGVVYAVHNAPESNALLFVASDVYTPDSIFELAVQNGNISETTVVTPVLSLDWIKRESVTLPQLVILDENDEVSAYHYPAYESDSKNSAIVWLHGGSMDFSPRWHQYAQYFSLSGYDFYALNYSIPWSAKPEKVARSFDTQAEETEALVNNLSKIYSHVFLMGVSTGTRVVQNVLSRNRVQVDAVVEYSPIDDLNWNIPRRLPPLLAFTGKNDSQLDHNKRVRDMNLHRAEGSDIEWVVFQNEGHDLRNRSSIEARIKRTVAFLGKFQLE